MRLLLAVALGIALWAGPAAAQWQDRAFAESPFVVAGPAFQGARGMARESLDAQSIRHWEGMFRTAGSNTLLVYVESLGTVTFDKEPARQRLERSGLDRQSFPNLTWGEAGQVTTGLGRFDYFHFTWGPPGSPQACIGFITVVETRGPCDRRGLHGAHCVPGTAKITTPAAEGMLKGVGIKGFHTPAG